jgi:hypothetical protein
MWTASSKPVAASSVPSDLGCRLPELYDAVAPGNREMIPVGGDVTLGRPVCVAGVLGALRNRPQPHRAVDTGAG